MICDDSEISTSGGTGVGCDYIRLLMLHCCCEARAAHSPHSAEASVRLYR